MPTGAIERHLSTRLAVTGTLMQSWSTADTAATDVIGLRDTRTDASGAVTAFLSPSIAVFGSVSRTLSPMEFDGSRYVFSGGIAFVLTPASEIPLRPPR